ncbi:MAG: hypothetical protein WBJ21_03970 [Burkholderiaceae bacterium]
MVTAKKTPAAKAVKKVIATKVTTAKPVARKSPLVKVLKQTKAAKAPAKPAVDKAPKQKKPKLVRDSFTMPQAEYDVLAEVKKSCIAAGFEIKKSELLRIGVALIKQLDSKKIQAAQASLLPLKAGRPSK